MRQTNETWTSVQNEDAGILRRFCASIELKKKRNICATKEPNQIQRFYSSQPEHASRWN